MRKIVPRYLTWLGVFVLVLSGCSQAAPTPESTQQAAVEKLSEVRLAGTAWDLESFGEPGDELLVIPGSRLTVHYLVERYAGSGGCNWYLGVYETEGSSLRMHAPALTGVICEPQGLMDQEATFMTSLANVTEYQIDDDKLIASTVENQRLLTFVPAEPTPFEVTTWELKLAFDGKRWVPVIPTSVVTAQFEGDQVSGSAGCNSYSATFEREGDALTISNLTSTEMSCSEPKGIMDQEDLYLSELQSVAGYTQVGGLLEMRHADGQPSLLFGVLSTSAPQTPTAEAASAPTQGVAALR